jgi:hypothetical protein
MMQTQRMPVFVSEYTKMASKRVAYLFGPVVFALLGIGRHLYSSYDVRNEEEADRDGL